MTAGTSPPSTGRSPGISIGVKIFGIATSLLGLLILVVYVFTDRLRQVNEEVTALAEYVIPITDRVAAIDVHALEQELHFERVQKLYEIEPVIGGSKCRSKLKQLLMRFSRCEELERSICRGSKQLPDDNSDDSG